ncbi:7-cyano-7-deazaguanine synthase [Streptomyces sp. NPDC101219]|uniref:7-cyano-7-deazaguanine synthase n=1 Tax=Streptomyces sp. NPDC101219 TaxID=3366131 RepID=UPI00381E1C9D
MRSGQGHTINDGRFGVAVFLSGGVDSTVLLGKMCAEESSELIAVHFAGFSSPEEAAAARAIAHQARVAYWSIDMSSLLLSWRSARVTQEGSGERAVFGAATMYSAALAFAMAHKINSVAFGLHREDAQEYIEQSPSFLNHIRQGIKLVGSEVRILVPFQDMSKCDIVRIGNALSVDMSRSWSCLRPSVSVQCGTCEACLSRRNAFRQAAVVDATQYERQ